MSAAIPDPPPADDPPARSLDDVEDNFGEAIIHSARGHTILGYQLRPFSRWHIAQLDFIGSPFAGHNKSVDFTALWLAAQVCQTRYPHSLSGPSFPSLPSVKNLPFRLFRVFRGQKKSGPSRRLIRKFGLPAGKAKRAFLLELNEFSAYIRDYSGGPEYITDEDSEATAVKTPWYLYQVAALVQSGLTRDQAWNESMGEGLWWLAATAEAKGAKIDIIKPSDRKQLAELGIE